MKYLVNAFTIAMCPKDSTHVDVTFRQASVEEARDWLKHNPDFVNRIGHIQTNNIVKAMLKVNIGKGKRVSTRLHNGDELLVAQYMGPRLPEGARTLPEGADIKFWWVEFRAFGGDDAEV